VKHIFLDTNVLIDFLADRQPLSLEAAKLFNYSFTNKVTLYVSVITYNNIYYILRRSSSHLDSIKILSELQEWTETIAVTKEIIRKSLTSDFRDFEDAIQYNSAKSLSKIDCIVTRDTKDYKISSISIFTPKEALTIIENAIQ
jgi:predicted nucleic acid-binding protein